MSTARKKHFALEPYTVCVTCFHCGHYVEVENRVRRTVGVTLDHVQRAGMILVEDEENDRYLVFCNESCRVANYDTGGYSKNGRVPPDRKLEIISTVYLLKA